MLNDFLAARLALRQVTVPFRDWQATPLIERALTNLVPFGRVSFTTTVCARSLLWLATFSISVKRDARLADFGADALIAVSTTRLATRSPRTPCAGTPGWTGCAKEHDPLDGPTLIPRSCRAAYMQRSGPTVTKSPREPPVRIGVTAPLKSTRSISPSLRATTRYSSSWAVAGA